MPWGIYVWVQHDSIRSFSYYSLHYFLANVISFFVQIFIQIIAYLFGYITSDGNLVNVLHENKISI